jgi:hypothetical protein
MSEKRPNVFNTQQTNNDQLDNSKNIDSANQNSDYDTKKMEVADEIYSTTASEYAPDAVLAMRKRTEEQIKLRDEALKKNTNLINNYQNQINDISNKPINNKVEEPKKEIVPENTIKIPELKMKDPYIDQISQPQFNSSFDVIPIPSQGKLYPNKKPNFKVSYLTTADENILTSPNLLNSGEFLEILINRKLLEPNIRYRDLHVGDRNAIMLWLRATSYGEIYTIELPDENGVSFETDINLHTLKTKHLGVDPDEEGYFDFYLPLAKAAIKFKLLTVGDIEDIDELVVKDKENNLPVNNKNTYILERQIIEVNGVRDRNFIKDFAQNIRIRDAKELKDYIESIESGVVLEIKVSTPGGSTIDTFLPLNLSFFWPDITI